MLPHDTRTPRQISYDRKMGVEAPRDHLTPAECHRIFHEILETVGHTDTIRSRFGFNMHSRWDRGLDGTYKHAEALRTLYRETIGREIASRAQ